MPAFCANTSGARCRRLPTPGEPYSTRPAFAAAINSRDALDRRFRIDQHQQAVEDAGGRDRAQIRQRVVAEVLVDMRRRRDRRRGEEQRQPVRRRRRDRARRDGAVGAEPVLDEERLLQIGGELLRDGARLQVRARARGEADEDADRMLGILLRVRGKGDEGERENTGACEASVRPPSWAAFNSSSVAVLSCGAHASALAGLPRAASRPFPSRRGDEAPQALVRNADP